MGQEITVREAIWQTAQLLNEIRVPAGLTQEIAAPICQAVKNLMACCEALDRAAERGKNGESGDRA